MDPQGAVHQHKSFTNSSPAFIGKNATEEIASIWK